MRTMRVMTRPRSDSGVAKTQAAAWIDTGLSTHAQFGARYVGELVDEEFVLR